MAPSDQSPRPEDADRPARDLRTASIPQLLAQWNRLEKAIATSEIDDTLTLLLDAASVVRDELRRRDTQILPGDGPRISSAGQVSRNFHRRDRETGPTIGETNSYGKTHAYPPEG